MEMQEICRIAQSQSIDPGNLSKSALIKSIQSTEGNFDCFSTAYGGECDQGNCSWREDCFVASIQGEAS